MSKRGKEKKRDIIPITTNIITTVTTTTTTTTKEIITNKNCTKYYAVNFETTMREWLLLFIVLATLQMGIVQVASTFSQLSSTFNSIELQRQQNQIREQVKTSLLNSLFKMNRPPKIDRSKIYIPDEMLKQWRDITGKDLKHEQNITRQLKTLPKNYNTIRSFTHKESKIDDRFPHHHRYRLYFDVKSIPADEKVKKAELKLTCDSISEELMPFHIAQRTRYRILVYDIVRVGVKGVRSSQHWLIDSKTVSLSSKTTISFDVQKAVDRWLATPNKNYGLFVEVHTTDVEKPAPHNHVRLRRSIGEPEHKWRHKQPVLITYTSDNHRVSRSKRTKMGRRKSRNETCSRHSLYIDFEDVGWNDWIVAPNSYDAFYCHGECPYALAEHLNSTNHAVIQTLVHHSYPEKVPKVCCVPTELEGISMLYLNDQNTVVLKNYQDMAVVGCGCQ